MALRPVVTNTRAPCLELGDPVAMDDPIQLGITQGSERRAVRFDQQLVPHTGSVDHRRERDRRGRPDPIAEVLVDHHLENTTLNVAALNVTALNVTALSVTT